MWYDIIVRNGKRYLQAHSGYLFSVAVIFPLTAGGDTCPHLLQPERGETMGLSKYEEWITPEGLAKIEGWAMDGLIDTEIAANMGVNPDTLYRWKRKYLEISEALKKGKDVVDRQVEKSLLKRALGFEYNETKNVYETDSNGNRILKESTITRKMVVPDTTAQIFWLKNRKPDKWRDKPETVKQGDTGLFEGIVKAVGGKFDAG